MNQQDNLAIFASGLEDARREKKARGQEDANLTLTIDLSKRNIDEIPQEAVGLLSQDVERCVVSFIALAIQSSLFHQYISHKSRD